MSIARHYTNILIGEENHLLLGLYITKLKQIPSIEIFSSSFYYGFLRILPAVHPDVIVIGTSMVLRNPQVIVDIKRKTKHMPAQIFVVGALGIEQAMKLLHQKISGYIDISRHSLDDLYDAVLQGIHEKVTTSP